MNAFNHLSHQDQMEILRNLVPIVCWIMSLWVTLFTALMCLLDNSFGHVSYCLLLNWILMCGGMSLSHPVAAILMAVGAMGVWILFPRVVVPWIVKKMESTND